MHVFILVNNEANIAVNIIPHVCTKLINKVITKMFKPNTHDQHMIFVQHFILILIILKCPWQYLLLYTSKYIFYSCINSLILNTQSVNITINRHFQSRLGKVEMCFHWFNQFHKILVVTHLV